MLDDVVVVDDDDDDDDSPPKLRAGAGAGAAGREVAGDDDDDVFPGRTSGVKPTTTSFPPCLPSSMPSRRSISRLYFMYRSKSALATLRLAPVRCCVLLCDACVMWRVMCVSRLYVRRR